MQDAAQDIALRDFVCEQQVEPSVDHQIDLIPKGRCWSICCRRCSVSRLKPPASEVL